MLVFVETKDDETWENAEIQQAVGMTKWKYLRNKFQCDWTKKNMRGKSDE